ncbi:hypothetical protein AAG895_05330 [Thauera sp. JM12B12]|uniref:hypothetical protein n=1 Tax=Thauera sp. JM12B12 TaxID=3142262 RepID=UPI0031F3631C
MSAPDNTSHEKRRRLIKAAAAAPVVFTLPSGAALAATSSPTCDAKSLTRFNTSSVDAVVSEPGDGWVRGRFQSWTFRIKSENSSSIGFKHLGNWYVVSNGSASLVLGEVFTNGSNAPSERLDQYHYVLLNYPDQTSLVFNASQADIAPIAGASCWNSLTPSANIPASNTVVILS